MFTYLNHCPPKIVFFYQDLFRKSSLNDIILALRNIQKTSFNTAKSSSTWILKKIAKLYPFLSLGDSPIEENGKTSEKLEQYYKVSNHPVHIQEKDGQKAPTALIPFCSFSDNFSWMGEKLPNLDTPVCNSFSPKVINDQLCFTMDPNPIHRINFNQLSQPGKELSITLYIDYNEDRNWPNVEHLGTNHIRLETLGTKQHKS